jgi:hypothetical protein
MRLPMNQQRLRQLLPFFGSETKATEKMSLARANPMFRVQQINQNFVALDNDFGCMGQFHFIHARPICGRTRAGSTRNVR